jgi:anhydro-N-acetylmuramic acid kinase
MSGTSLDGVDAALADLGGHQPRLVASHFLPYPEALRGALIELHAPAATIDQAAGLANEVTRLYARAVLELTGRSGTAGIAAVGCHGQTVRHEPRGGYTVQLVNGALLAEATSLTAVVDFRSRDIAAGGQGAPLVPAFHAACFSEPGRDRAIVNLGGIANVTRLPRSGPVTGFDTGPGNMLLDAWARQRFGSSHDSEGGIAASGKVIEPLLARMLVDDYFAAAPPKSTGRDRFNDAWLARFPAAEHRAEDVQATLTELTARTVSRAIAAHCPGTTEVFVCGGGVHNRELMRRLAAGLSQSRTASTVELGIDPDWVEAMAFAWLAKQALEGKPGNVAGVTGARGPRVLGAIYPA